MQKNLTFKVGSKDATGKCVEGKTIPEKTDDTSKSTESLEGFWPIKQDPVNKLHRS